MSINIWIRRGILVVFSIIVLGACISLLSMLEVSTRAYDKDGFKLQLEDYDFFVDLPKTEWHDSSAMAPFLKEELELAYVQGLKLLDNCRNSSSIFGLTTYFTNDFIENYKLMESKKIPVRSHLEHNLNVKFLNQDRSWIQLQDSSLITFTHNDVQWFQEKSQILMELTDEGWKIDEITILITEEVSTENELNEAPHLQYGVNYYPADYPWLGFWSNYSMGDVQKDLMSIQELGFDHVRIFIPYLRFVHPDLIEDINHFYKTCDALDLNVISTLFDFPQSYKLDAYPNHYKYLNQIHSASKGTKQPILYDLKNEPDLDFEAHGRANVERWLGFVIQGLRYLAPQKPQTIGWSTIDNIAVSMDKLEVISFHYYESPYKFERDISVHLDGLSKPWLLSEFGFPGCAPSSWLWPDHEEQYRYLTQMYDLFNKYKVSNTLWCYSDFSEVPNYVFGWNPRTRRIQGSYGLRSIDGKLKFPFDLKK